MIHPPKDYIFQRMISEGLSSAWIGRHKDGESDLLIKTLNLKKVEDWKGIELFEREMKTLRQLDHPRIPKFIDFIEDTYEGAHRWHIVQEMVKGETITAYSKATISASFVKDLAVQVLKTLHYLQDFSPPLLHRDIKPDNLIINPSGEIFLIDFGSVSHVVPSKRGGSTIVGTSGYMAPEQLMGRADSSSDLYGLGMVLVYLLTNTDPGDLPREGMRVQWENSSIEIDADLRFFVNKLTSPKPEERFKDAAEALEESSSAAPPMLAETYASRGIEVRQVDGNTILVRGSGTKINLKTTVVLLSIIGFIALLGGWAFYSTFSAIFLVPLASWVFYLSVLSYKSTNTRFRIEHEKVFILKGWIFKSSYSFPLSQLLNTESVHDTSIYIDGIELTGMMSIRDQIHLKELAKKMATRAPRLNP